MRFRSAQRISGYRPSGGRIVAGHGSRPVQGASLRAGVRIHDQRKTRFSLTVASSNNAATPLCAVASGSGSARITISGPSTSCASSTIASSAPRHAYAGQFSRAPRGDAERAEHQRRRDRAEAMRKVNRYARGMVEHAAFVVDAESAPQHERVCRVHLRPPRVLAGRKIRAGERRVVAARPAAESDLENENDQARQRELLAAAAAGGWGLGPNVSPGSSPGPGTRDSSAIASHASSENVASPPNRCSTTISGLSSKRHRPHAEQSLEDHEADERNRQARPAVPDRRDSRSQDRRAPGSRSPASRRSTDAPSP